jgi:anti-sigma-K factor RskA
VDVKAYIESGVIESYIMGMADEQEVSELMQLAAQHPEIKAALYEAEASLEAFAMANATPPPPDVKTAVFAAIAHEFAPATEAKIVRFNVRWVAAAAVILLVVSSSLNIYFYNRFKETTDQYQALVLQKNTLQANNQIMQTKSLDLYNSMQMMTDPAMLKVAMPGIVGKENSYATVFWDTKSRDVYILPNKLAQPAKGKQYQLWAIVDGKPVDAGMISNCAGLCKMKNIPKASMFAITLEQEGGSPVPTLSEMYVAGKVG